MLPFVAEMDYLTGKLTELCGDTEVPAVPLQRKQAASTQTEFCSLSVSTQMPELTFSSSSSQTMQKDQVNSPQRTDSILRKLLKKPEPQPQSASTGVHNFIRERLAKLQQPLPRSTLIQKDGIVQKIRSVPKKPAQTDTQNTTPRSLPPWDQVNIFAIKFYT